MTMYFRASPTASKFEKFCASRGFKHSTRLEGPKHIVTADVPEKEKWDFVAAWSDMTCKVYDASGFRKPRARQGKLF
jgi:hypothetical protein